MAGISPQSLHPPPSSLLLPSFLGRRPPRPRPSYAPAIRQIIRGYVLLFLLRAAKDFLGMVASLEELRESPGKKPEASPRSVAYKYSVKMQSENTGGRGTVCRFFSRSRFKGKEAKKRGSSLQCSLDIGINGFVIGFSDVHARIALLFSLSLSVSSFRVDLFFSSSRLGSS